MRSVPTSAIDPNLRQTVAPSIKRRDGPGTVSSGTADAAARKKPKTAAPPAATPRAQTPSARIPFAPGGNTQQRSAAAAALAKKNIPLQAPSAAAGTGTSLQATIAEVAVLKNQVASQNKRTVLNEKELLRYKDELRRTKDELDCTKNELHCAKDNIVQLKDGHTAVLQEINELRAMFIKLQASDAATEQAKATAASKPRTASSGWDIAAKDTVGLTEEAKTARRNLQVSVRRLNELSVLTFCAL